MAKVELKSLTKYVFPRIDKDEEIVYEFETIIDDDKLTISINETNGMLEIDTNNHPINYEDLTKSIKLANDTLNFIKERIEE